MITHRRRGGKGKRRNGMVVLQCSRDRIMACPEREWRGILPKTRREKGVQKPEGRRKKKERRANRWEKKKGEVRGNLRGSIK